jgi:DNA-binding transcriptional ArsR family regulator
MQGMGPPSGNLGSPGTPLPADVAERVADAMFALSTPSRVQILRVLMGGPCAVSDLVETLGMEQSAVSHQLRVLREHSLIRAQRVGRQRRYALSDDEVGVFIEAALRHIQHRSGADLPEVHFRSKLS